MFWKTVQHIHDNRNCFWHNFIIFQVSDIFPIQIRLIYKSHKLKINFFGTKNKLFINGKKVTLVFFARN